LGAACGRACDTEAMPENNVSFTINWKIGKCGPRQAGRADTKNIKKQVNSEKIKQRQIRCLVSFLVKVPGRFFAYKVPKARWVVDFRQVGFGHVTEEHFDHIF